MKLFDWILPKPETATVPELEAQLASAKQAHQEGTEKVEEVAAAFDLDPSKEGALLKAQEAVSRCQAHVERAERLLAAGRRRESDARHQELLAIREKLEAQQAKDRRKASEELPEQVAAALLKVTELQAERITYDEELARRERELVEVIRELEGLSESSDREAFYAVPERVKIGRPNTWFGLAVRLYEDELRKLPGRTDSRFSSPMETATNDLKAAFK